MDWRFACYDRTDDGGCLVRELFPNPAELPHFVKTAQLVDPSVGPEAWALTYNDEMVQLSKFAMVDRGNTWLSTLYFTRTGSSLPPPLRKLAARRLETACELFNLNAPPQLHELAQGLAVQVTAPSEFVKLANFVQQKREQEAFKDYTEEDVVDVPAPKTKTAAAREIDTGALARGLQLRMLMIAEDDRGDVVTAFEKVAMAGPALVGFVEKLDQITGLFQHWGGLLPDPVSTVYGTSGAAPELRKVASRLCYAGKTALTEDDLQKLAMSSVLSENFPHSFVEQFRESPVAVFESLPRDTQATLASLVKRVR